MRIVPAIDLIDGKCVRLKQGVFSESEVVAADPLETARAFSDAGFSRLHLVDLSGAKAGSPQHLPVLRSICEETNLQVDFSGGLRTEGDLIQAFEAGATQVVIGSAAVKAREQFSLWLQKFGGNRIILGLDVLDDFVRISGWEEETPHTLNEVIGWYLPLGLRHVMSTDISRDGMLQGPSLDLYKRLTEKFPQLFIIASGGVANAKDIAELAGLKIPETIVGKALYSGSLVLEDVKEWVW